MKIRAIALSLLLLAGMLIIPGPPSSFATTQGSLLVIVTQENSNSTSTVTITDSAGTNTWTQLRTDVCSGSRAAAVFYAANTNPVTSVTATWSGSLSASVSAVVYEVAGAATSSPVDQSSTQHNCGTTTSIQSTSITTTNANDILLYGVVFGGSQVGDTAGTGFTFPTGSITTRADMDYDIVSSTQTAFTTTTTWTSPSVNAIGIIGAFKQGTTLSVLQAKNNAVTSATAVTVTMGGGGGRPPGQWPKVIGSIVAVLTKDEVSSIFAKVSRGPDGPV